MKRFWLADILVPPGIGKAFLAGLHTNLFLEPEPNEARTQRGAVKKIHTPEMLIY